MESTGSVDSTGKHIGITTSQIMILALKLWIGVKMTY